LVISLEVQLTSVSNAKEVTKEVHPQLFNVVDEMRIASNLPAMPKIYIINSPAPNAFATGRNPKSSAIAVTAGLLSMLNRDELQGVVAHETSHILNRDIRFMTYASIMLGTIVLISEVFLRGMFYSSLAGGRRSSSSRGGGQGQLIIMIIAIALSILAPLFATLLYFAISRKREYLADASAVRLTRYPEGLASALEKIAGSHEELKTATKVTAPLYINNPLKRKGRKASSLQSTHPPIHERIKILRNMAHGANFSDYQEAFSNVKGSVKPIIPASGLTDHEDIQIRKGEAGKGKIKNARQSKRNLEDLMLNVDRYNFINCVCGLKMKVPPGYSGNEISCPRCGRKHKTIK
jgi:heat shock protein HtpX